MIDYNFLQYKYLVNTYVNRKLTFVKGEGVFLIDENKQKYLDLMSNYGVSILGYDHPILTKALTKQLQNLTTLHGSFANDVRAEAASALVKRCGSSYTNVYFANSGAEAIEAALKFSVLTTGKKKFLVAKQGYHGKTLGALSATDEEKYKSPFAPLLWKFESVPFNNPQALNNAIDDKVAAFIVEPVQGESGIFVPDETYLSQVQEICTKKGILLIIDEIQTGNGRTGKFLSSDGIRADILCLGKGLAGGIPVGATIVSSIVAASVFKGIHSSTFGGNPLACAGILEILKLIDAPMLKHVEEIGTYFLSALKKLESPLIIQVRGKGLMIGLEVSSDKRNKILQLLQKEYILVIPAGENVVRLLPPFIIEREHIEIALDKIKKVLATI